MLLKGRLFVSNRIRIVACYTFHGKRERELYDDYCGGLFRCLSKIKYSLRGDFEFRTYHGLWWKSQSPLSRCFFWLTRQQFLTTNFSGLGLVPFDNHWGVPLSLGAGQNSCEVYNRVVYALSTTICSLEKNRYFLVGALVLLFLVWARASTLLVLVEVEPLKYAGDKICTFLLFAVVWVPTELLELWCARTVAINSCSTARPPSWHR